MAKPSTLGLHHKGSSMVSDSDPDLSSDDDGESSEREQRRPRTRNQVLTVGQRKISYEGWHGRGIVGRGEIVRIRPMRKLDGHAVKK